MAQPGAEPAHRPVRFYTVLVIKKLPTALMVTIALALALPAIGAASLPKPATNLIEVPISIGGVKLAQALKTADKAWGQRGACDLQTSLKSCTYEGDTPEEGRAVIDAAFRNRVTSFAIEAGLDAEDKFVFEGRLRKFETAEGIGLGDKRKTVKSVYPRAIATAQKTGYLVEGKGKSYMTFQTLDGRHITAIAVADGKHQG